MDGLPCGLVVKHVGSKVFPSMSKARAMIEPYYQDSMVTLFCGDSREIAPQLSGITACVTDPPYGLEFMGVAWDTFKDRPKGKERTRNEWSDFGSREHARHPSQRARIQRNKGLAFYEFSLEWADAVRQACLPGAPLLAFGGTRTFHRQACAIEDAGWELRDTLAWLYGSGFPKSLDIGKAIDKAANVEREVVSTIKKTHFGGENSGDAWIRPSHYNHDGSPKRTMDITAPSTDAAKLWDGYGTALKPAYEPITLAMNPLDGTYAANAVKHGVAGLNVEGCRVDFQDGERESLYRPMTENNSVGWKNTSKAMGYNTPDGLPPTAGRFPANVIHDGSDEVTRLFPETTSGTFNGHRNEPKTKNAFGKFDLRDERSHEGNSGSAARFFYTAKASSSERGKGNNHPTVKPLDLMKYLVKLVSMPERNLILDPFAGSGTTLYAAKELGVKCVGVELSEAYCEIIAERLRQEVIWSAMEGS